MLLRILRSLIRREQTGAGAGHDVATPRPAPPPDPRDAVLRRLAAFETDGPLAAGGDHVDDPAASRAQAVRNAELDSLLRHVQGLEPGPLSDESVLRVAEYRSRFDAALGGRRGSVVFAFHADLPRGESVDYVDARLRVHDFDYADIVRRFAAHVRGAWPGARVVIATSTEDRLRDLSLEGADIVALPVDARFPMLERARAACAYVQSAGFGGNTAFLDADAFVNRSLDDVFSMSFDLAFTYRTQSNMMPINEGAFFARAENPQAVRDFLSCRLAIYDRIATDERVSAYYGDTRRWRGGQLSLNAICGPAQPYTPYRATSLRGASVRFLPCDTFNFALGDGESLESSRTLDQRYIVHFKGPRKYALAKR